MNIDPHADDLYQQLVDKYNQPFTINQLMEDYNILSKTIEQDRIFTNKHRMSLYLLVAKQTSFYEARLYHVHN